MSCRSAVDDLMTGAIGHLLPKLGEFLKQEHNLQTSMKGHIESLETQVRRMHYTALSEIPRVQQQQQYDKNCAYELRELSYDIEDIVDNLLLPIDDAWEPMANQDSFRATLEGIKAQVKNLAAWQAESVAKPTTGTVVDPSLGDGFMQVRQLVGIHNLKAELISRMMSSSSQRLEIFTIWGAGGMGKTTTAKAVYADIKGKFNCCAFVSVGHQPDMKKALRDILIHLGGKKRYSDVNTAMVDEGQLINELQHFLKEKRFLIVIDDIRDIPSWEVIKCALVDNGCGSRIIITSRALYASESSGEDLKVIDKWHIPYEVIKCPLMDDGSGIIITSRVRGGATESSGVVLKLLPLSIDHSKELFYATFCARKGPIKFDAQDEQIIEYILHRCVPLDTIMVASLLAGKPHEEWTEVYNSIIGFWQEEDNIGADENKTRKIIQFSYYDLPSHLKTCLLYFSIFPENHVIEKDMLVWRWVAEGFVHDDREQEESLFKVGERYLYELVSRSMILLAVQNEDTNICVCSVEGMVLDWIRTVAREENFVNVLSGDWYDHDEHHHQSNNARIMAVQNCRALDKCHDDLAGTWKKPKVRSFNGIGCHINNSSISLLAHCQVLRVLSLQGCKLPGLKNLIAGLLHLRYLGLGGMDIRDPMIDIGHLRCLQTLDLTDTYIGALPHGVTQLRQLKCLRCVSSTRLELPKGMGNLTSLEELCLKRVIGEEDLQVFCEELRKLIELRVLRIHTVCILDGIASDALVQSLSKLQKIEVVELRSVDVPKNLTRLERVSVFDLVRSWHWASAPGAFPILRYLKMNAWLIPKPGAMPWLKSVEFEVPVRALKDEYFDFHDFRKLSYLCVLEKAHVVINCWEAKIEEAEEAETALRHAVQSHPKRPRLILKRIGQFVDDKQVRSFGGLHGSRLAPQVIPLELLREITNNFSEKQRLGRGTFGTVYKGVLYGKDHNKEVAVKLLHQSMAQMLNYEEEFMKEFENVRRLNHPNIVQLLGFCYETKRVGVEYEGKYVLADKIYRALCFDYMHNGSLQQHLADESNGLDWQTRYKIIMGTCEGLKYLHKGLENTMLHLDLKPGNILLDKNMVPKIADFGLSKLVIDNKTRDTSSPLGTIRYCPPEHFMGYLFSTKFDIFSLGVVIIEIIAGSRGYDKRTEMSSQEEFIDHVQGNWRKRIHKATLFCTSPKCECYQVKRCIETALQCVHPERTKRPDIGDIISSLNRTENNFEKSATTSSSRNEA